jgi:hypothetical protein
MTCSQDNLEHAVTDEQASLVIRTGRGIYLSICGHQIIRTALSRPPGCRCADVRRYASRIPPGAALTARNVWEPPSRSVEVVAFDKQERILGTN